MKERHKLLESIASTIKDYRKGEIPTPTPQHVERWVKQFSREVQLPLLGELDYVLKRTYFPRTKMKQFFSEQIEQGELAGTSPCDYWRKAHFLKIQQRGHSQAEMRQLFDEVLKEKCGLGIAQCGGVGGDYIYLDDVMFTGDRARQDLAAWIATDAPERATVRVLAVAMHRRGKWYCDKELSKIARKAGKRLAFQFKADLSIENRKTHRSKSEVLWPTALPDDENLKAYMAQEQRFPFAPRDPNGKLENSIFSSEAGRQLLERELLMAGVRIWALSRNPKEILRPLGYSRFGLGFGSMIVTYRNCPNNTPLALWWGDSKFGPNHPLSQWYPLFPRKTYAKDTDDSVF